jgi:hypothetical protein
VEYLERRLRRSARRYKNNPEVLRGFLEKSRLFPKKGKRKKVKRKGKGQ